MPQIIPIRDLKNTSENGYGDMVIMSMEAYEERMRMLDVYTRLSQAEEEIKAGKTRKAEDSMKELKEKYGL